MASEGQSGGQAGDFATHIIFLFEAIEEVEFITETKAREDCTRSEGG